MMTPGVPIPTTDAKGVKMFDVAMTQKEWEEDSERGVHPLPQLSEERLAEILHLDQLAHKRAILRLIMSHPTEYERRLEDLRREYGIEKLVQSTWISTIEDLQMENQ